MLGFALAPSKALACGTKAEKSCCQKDNSSKNPNTNNCCKKDLGDCGGKCGNESCHCPISHVSFIVPSFQDPTNYSYLVSSKKQKFSFIETNSSSGFYSIWAPPNIG